MTTSKLMSELTERANVVLDEGYSTVDIMRSAFADFTALGSMSGVLSVLSSGKLTGHQIELAKRIIVKTLAVIEKQQPPDD